MSLASLRTLPEMKAEACRRTGLRNFGDPWFEEPLGVLLAAMHDEARLNAIGVEIYGERLLTGLCNRLKIRDFIDRHPDVHQMPVEVGAVIVGLGRSGSTLLQRLLAEARDATAIYWWESLTPVPLDNELPGDPQQRRAIAKAAVDAMLAASPDLLAIHPLDAFAADEEVMLLEQSFVSSAPESFLNVPSYARWLAAADQTPAYRELREVLQLLTWQDRSRIGKKWILKTPHHLTALQTVVATFPDAKIVMPHRDPVKTVVSWCSLVATLSSPNSDLLDLTQIGRHWSARLKRNLEDFIRVRDGLDAERFVDVDYEALTREPIATAAQVLCDIGMAADEGDLARLREWLRVNAREQRRAHDYAAAQFGLDEQVLAHAFMFYRKRFLLDADLS